jgi:hypothetical protein
MQKEVLAMEKKYWLLLLVFAVLLNGNPVLADGDFYVVAGGGGVGTKITSLPYTITNSGFYYIGKDLTSTTGNGIIVNTDNVTIDLMGFSLIGPGEGTNFGIQMQEKQNVEIRNGTVRGFSYGISAVGATFSANHRVVGVRVEHNAGDGISLMGHNCLVRNCNASNNASGITVLGGGAIIDNIACNNTKTGITISVSGNIIGNVANGNDNGISVAGTATLVDRNTATGNSTLNMDKNVATCVYGTNLAP